MSDEKLEEKIDKIADKISNIDITLGKQSVILEEHVRRTNLLEEQIKPIERHVNMVQGGIKLLGLIALVASVLEGARRIFGK